MHTTLICTRHNNSQTPAKINLNSRERSKRSRSPPPRLPIAPHTLALSLTALHLHTCIKNGGLPAYSEPAWTHLGVELRNKVGALRPLLVDLASSCSERLAPARKQLLVAVPSFPSREAMNFYSMIITGVVTKIINFVDYVHHIRVHFLAKINFTCVTFSPRQRKTSSLSPNNNDNNNNNTRNNHIITVYSNNNNYNVIITCLET